eukprot:Hpha_TRINITY_DN32622_c0_g1::TRINITY_DN32622_c0_g1_i1::g.30326::m.30326
MAPTEKEGKVDPGYFNPFRPDSMTDAMFAAMLFWGLSWLCATLSSASMYDLRARSFAIMSALSALFALAGSAMAAGCGALCAQMFDPVRAVAASVWLGTIVLNVYLGIVENSPVLMIICGSLQWLSQLWYQLSYIPYARDCLIGCTKKIGGWLCTGS